MVKNNKLSIYILKLGGSLLTDKNNQFSLRKNVIMNIIHQIKQSNTKLIIVHGGGSYGHPLAKQYKLKDGLNNLIEDQLLGLAKTHDAMVQFNSFVIQQFLEVRLPAISIQSSSLFFDYPPLRFHGSELIYKCLNLGLIPILYGDIMLKGQKSFTILSGDIIIVSLCKQLENLFVKKVIFGMEIDGLFKKDEHKKKPVLVSRISADKLDTIELASLGTKIDVTRGILGKLDAVKKICELDIPVQFVNGLKPNNIQKALSGQEIISTEIF